MKVARRIAGRCVHASVLLATAWALIATGAPPREPVPARDCFVGVSSQTRLRVTIGPGEAPAISGIGPSCGGVDGLVAGAQIVFGPLQQGPRPSDNGGHCYGYETRSFTEGLGDITLPTDEPGSYWSAWYDAFAGAHGQFLSSRAEGCRGSWQLTLAPETAPAQGELISPLDAGIGRAWIIERTIQVAQAQFCDGTFTVAGYLSCADRFIVASVTGEMVP